jgi:hypothetical protein
MAMHATSIVRLLPLLFGAVLAAQVVVPGPAATGPGAVPAAQKPAGSTSAGKIWDAAPNKEDAERGAAWRFCCARRRHAAIAEVFGVVMTP